MITTSLYFSDVFEVDADVLENYGAFNISLVNDLPLFIDPFLLFNSRNTRYQELHDQIIAYVRFLKDMAEGGRIDEGLLRSWFTFSEVKQNWLGYSLVGNSGSGLGLEFAQALHANLHTIFSDFGTESITKSSHLEKLCLIKNGVGRDTISDFTTNLIKEFLLEYTQDFAVENLTAGHRRKIQVPRVRFNYRTRTWETDSFELPYYNGDYAILTPKDLLTKDDTWINKTDLVRDFDSITYSVPNDQLRGQINEYFHRVLPRDPRRAEFHAAVSQVVAKYPEFLDYYIGYKESNGDQATALSTERVREIEQMFIRDLSNFVGLLNRESGFYGVGRDTHEETRQRVLFLKDVIETKGGHKLFYSAGEPIRRESDLQIMFRLTWFATTSDVSREVNDGRGPVDFKVSRGAPDKTLAEFKLAKNTKLRRNLEKQLEIYQKASDAKRGLKVILYFTDEELVKVEGILRDLGLTDHPNIVLIDARDSNKPSGSTA